ncbi:MAG: hypothetical protein WEF86_02755 [Gemmatimonadota bacterium]
MLALYWDGHTAIPDDLAWRLADYLEQRAESIHALAATLRSHLNHTSR